MGTGLICTKGHFLRRDIFERKQFCTKGHFFTRGHFRTKAHFCTIVKNKSIKLKDIIIVKKQHEKEKLKKKQPTEGKG